MLQIKHITHRKNLCELKVKAICSQLVSLGIKMESFPSCFKEDVDKISRVNVSHCSDWYKLKVVPNKIELWHVDILGDFDRLVSEITDDGITTPDLLNF